MEDEKLFAEMDLQSTSQSQEYLTFTTYSTSGLLFVIQNIEATKNHVQVAALTIIQRNRVWTSILILMVNISIKGTQAYFKL